MSEQKEKDYVEALILMLHQYCKDKWDRDFIDHHCMSAGESAFIALGLKDERGLAKRYTTTEELNEICRKFGIEEW